MITDELSQLPAAGKNTDLLEKQARKFKPDIVAVFDEEAANCIIKLREEVDSLKSTVNELKAEIESLKKAISV